MAARQARRYTVEVARTVMDVPEDIESLTLRGKQIMKAI